MQIHFGTRESTPETLDFEKKAPEPIPRDIGDAHRLGYLSWKAPN